MMNKSKNKCKDKEEKITNNDNKWKKIKSIIEYIIIFVVITISAILIFKSIKNPNKVPSLFGKKACVIISGSMIPEIQVGDIVIINDTSDVKVGDIIAFRRDSTVIVHRIVEKVEINEVEMYQTKGDNNDVADIGLVEVSNIEGVIVGKIPYIGSLLIWAYNNLVLVVTIVIGIIILRYYSKN